MQESLTVSPTSSPRMVKTADGKILVIPDDWDLLPPGDAGLTRRVKALGPSWLVEVVKGRKKFSQGLWAPAGNIEVAKVELEVERATPQYQKKLEQGRQRREKEQAEYVEDFEQAVARFLKFSPTYEKEQSKFAKAVTKHATPVGSGTVARTERIPLEQRVEAAVIAWMRHQTTAYDNMSIARIKGERREVRRQLAEVSRAVLSLHRKGEKHLVSSCPLCFALSKIEEPTNPLR